MRTLSMSCAKSTASSRRLVDVVRHASRVTVHLAFSLTGFSGSPLAESPLASLTLLHPTPAVTVTWFQFRGCHFIERIFASPLTGL